MIRPARPRILAFVTCFLAATASVSAVAAETSSISQASAPQSSADARLKAIYDAEWAWRMDQFAMVRDEDGWDANADRLPRVDPASQAARLAYWTDVLKRLDAIAPDALSAEERINYAVFRTSVEALAADIRFKGYEMPFNSDSSFWAHLAPSRGFRTADDYRRYIARMRDVPRYFDENIANMRAGLKRGFSVPRATLTGRDASIEPFASADAAGNPFMVPFAQMPDNIPAATREELRRQGEAALRDAVVPAYARLLAFMRTEYMLRARTTLAAEALPDGKAYYAAQIREYTTLDLTAAQIHEIGLKEVARIDAEMHKVMAKSGFTGTFPEFLKFLRTDPQFTAKTPRELLSYSAYVAKKMDGKLKDAFGLLPRYRFTIRPVPDAIAPFWTAGRGGLEACWMNTYDLPSRPLYNIPALTLHECSPGHSFQAALALEAPARPDFRRETYFSGYGEGWGLYTEWLGGKLGIYETPYEEFGQLSYEMWRAARLVIDTGVHSKGWSRDQAIAYLRDHTALSEHEVETEVDRYISWPGQALAYKLGEMTIRRLRAEAEARLGEKFDQRPFHDAILALGGVPLPVLEQRIHEFIANGGK
ncbi:DUF885 domain-containing protein [Sphingomonas fennica]|uniref:DUF885 domain-containing protein n=1 Tax=Edaphosphingomonas fennica TaxID=114404 RepID=A0A2T4HN13_9SPHN|nr:DUF885 family protein [Sphingomonas fennica]PTD17180.1 DUF885 domain-containing protein [Sphingomonas fennica]